jgi:hypothetical protein
MGIENYVPEGVAIRDIERVRDFGLLNQPKYLDWCANPRFHSAEILLMEILILVVCYVILV